MKGLFIKTVLIHPTATEQTVTTVLTTSYLKPLQPITEYQHKKSEFKPGGFKFQVQHAQNIYESRKTQA